jgi:hypothetical protein
MVTGITTRVLRELWSRLLQKFAKSNWQRGERGGKGYKGERGGGMIPQGLFHPLPPPPSGWPLLPNSSPTIPQQTITDPAALKFVLSQF